MQKKNFEQVLCANENRIIGLYLTGNQFVEGILLDVQNNHIVLEVNENIVYFAIHQIQALSRNAKDLSIVKESSPHLVRNDLTDVLIALRYHWVTLNNFSNPTLFGILSSIFEDHVILINNKELFYVPISHITDISSRVSKSDYSFLNKKEQLTIQKLYRLGISKGSFEVKADNLIVEQDRITPADIRSIPDVVGPINKAKVDQNTVSTLLTEKTNSAVSDQEVATIEGSILKEATEPINTDALEEYAFYTQLEAKLKSISLDLAETKTNSLVSDQEVATIDDSLKEVTEPINTDALAENALSTQMEENLESISFDLAEAEANSLVSEQEESTIIDGVHTEVMEPIDLQLDLPENPLNLKGKGILLTAWSTMNNDQSTVALPKKTNSIRALSTPIENTMMTSRNKGLNKQISISNHINENSDREDKLDVLDKISEASEKKKKIITTNRLSQKEINEMLEQQYFALMNYAAVQISNAINLKQIENKSYFHPRIEGNEHSPNKIRHCEMIRGYPVYDSKQDTVALEKQYISLMRHATTMYRKLRKY